MPLQNLPPLGARVCLRRDVERGMNFIAAKGATGTVVLSDDSGACEDSSVVLAIRMDRLIKGAEEWDNELQYTAEDGDDYEGGLEALLAADLEELKVHASAPELSFLPQRRIDFAIQQGAFRADIDDAFIMVMVAIGQEDGAYPEMFSDSRGDKDADGWRDTWPSMTTEQRAAELRAYVEWEKQRGAGTAKEA